MSDNSSGFRSMSVLAAEMRSAVIELGGPCASGERDRWFERVARRAGISFRSAKSLFHRESEFPRSQTVERVRAAIKAKREDEAAAREEYRRTVDLLERIAIRLDTDDADFHSPSTDALRAFVSARRGDRRPLD